MEVEVRDRVGGKDGGGCKSSSGGGGGCGGRGRGRGGSGGEPRSGDII